MNSGSEANDLAVLMARAYTNNFDVVTIENCYHGMTYQTMALTSNSAYKYAVPQMSGVHNVGIISIKTTLTVHVGVIFIWVLII